MKLTTLALTALALACFAANSLLCREALSSGGVDAASFTTLRLTAGALVLAILARGRLRSRGSGARAAALCVYALAFSFAYRELTAATGALLLFVAVQTTMLVGAFHAGERLGIGRWAGMAVAMSGVLYLLSPGVATPPLGAAGSMLGSGVAWGVYSLLGRRSGDALAATASDFLWASVPAIVVSAMRPGALAVTPGGLGLAFASGALASGIGYALWFAALRHLSSSEAAVTQLAVPVLAGLGGAVFLSEPLSGRLVVTAVVVLGGIALSLSAPSPTNRGGTSAEGRGSRQAGSPRAARPREAPASTA